MSGGWRRAFQVERRGIEPVPATDRHGSPGQLFSLWWSANLGFPAWAIGVLALALGLGLRAAVLALVLGNVVVAVLLAAASALGPETGVPQLPLTRRSFGYFGTYLPALLNWLSTLGWYAVNTVLGADALARLLGWSFLPGLLVLTVVQVVVAVFGYDAIHTVERWAAWILAALFAGMSVVALVRPGVGVAWTTQPFGSVGMFILTVAISASYLFSWAPYAADYARYLPVNAGRGRVFRATFLGALLSTLWVELLGAAMATLATAATPIALLVRVLGRFSAPALVAVVLGTITADVLNIYTGALSALTMDVPLSRAAAAVVVGLVGAVASWYGYVGFAGKYEDFLLLISYWIGPWLAVVLVDLYTRRGDFASADLARRRPGIRLAGFVAFLAGVLASIPFMSQTLYEGPVARALGGGDVAYWVGMVVAALVFMGLRAVTRTQAPPAGA